MFTLRSFGVAATAWPASSTADDAPGPMTRAVPGRERNSYAVQSDAHRAHTTRHCTATPVHAAERRVACASPPTTAYSSRTPRALPRHSPSSDTVPTDTPPVQSPPHTTNTVPIPHLHGDRRRTCARRCFPRRPQTTSPPPSSPKHAPGAAGRACTGAVPGHVATRRAQRTGAGQRTAIRPSYGCWGPPVRRTVDC
jgi:hypothetical protein